MPAAPILVRFAQPSDAPSLVQFNSAMAEETEGKLLRPERLQPGVAAALADARHGFYLIAEVDGVVAGCLLVTYEWSDWRNGVFWWIQSVYVRPEHRGRGVYRALHTEVRRRALADGGVCGLRLYVERDNLRAQATYRAMGMADAGYVVYGEEFGT